MVWHCIARLFHVNIPSIQYSNFLHLLDSVFSNLHRLSNQNYFVKTMVHLYIDFGGKELKRGLPHHGVIYPSHVPAFPTKRRKWRKWRMGCLYTNLPSYNFGLKNWIRDDIIMRVKRKDESRSSSVLSFTKELFLCLSSRQFQ